MAINYKDLLLKEVKELLKKLPPNVRIRVYYDDMGKNKYTLNQIGDMVLSLGTRLDNLEKDVNSLKQDVKDVNARIDRIDTRLDGIEARLDYNGLKKLPTNR
ncbi:MAG: hypothetical protein MJ213_00570 [Bacilli bacterium]|nr:hypothetical protein [Bacilli bacterium]